MEETKRNSDSLKLEVQKNDDELTAMNQGFQDMEKEVIKQLNAVEDKILSRGISSLFTAYNEAVTNLKSSLIIESMVSNPK